MAFDAQAAKEAGYTDKEIADYLTSKGGGSNYAPMSSHRDPMSYSPGELAAFRKKVVADDGDAMTRLKEMLPSRQTVATIARPLLEGGGAVAGGALATPETLGAATVPGAAIGYGIGKKLADMVEGTPTPQYTRSPLANEFINSAGDVATGATLEMGGQLAAKGIGATLTALRNTKAAGLPFTTKRAQTTAGQALSDILESSPEAATTNAARQVQTDATLNRIGTDVVPTPGQSTGNVRAAALEQSMAARDPAFAEKLKFNDAALNEAGLDNLTATVGKGEAAPIATQPAQQTGADLLESIQSTRDAAKQVHEQLYKNLPNTPLPTDDIAATIKGLKQEFRPGDESVFPSSVIAKVEDTIAPPPPKPAPAILNEFGQPMAQTAQPAVATEVGFQDLHSLRKDIGRQIQSAMTGANPNRELAMKLGKIKDSIDRTIETNLAASDTYQTAKSAFQDYASKFRTGAVDQVTRRGNQLSGLKTADEAVPAKFFTPTGADDLIRSVGQVTAKRQMLPHVTEQITSKTVGPDGVMHIPRAMAYLRQNQQVLDQLGLTGEVRGIIKDQIPGFLRQQIESKGIDVSGNPVMTARQAAKMVRDLAPAMKQVYSGDMKPLQALRDYHTVLDILSRNKNVSYSGGSNTVEKLFGNAPAGSLGRKLVDNLSSTLIGGTTGAAIGGPVGAAVGGTAGLAAKAAYSTAAEHSAQMVKLLLQDAITNPETAKMLMDIAKGAKVAPTVINARLATLGLIGAKDSGGASANQQDMTE